MPAEKYVDVYVVNNLHLAEAPLENQPPQDSQLPLGSHHKMSMSLTILSFPLAPNVKKKQKGMLES